MSFVDFIRVPVRESTRVRVVVSIVSQKCSDRLVSSSRLVRVLKVRGLFENSKAGERSVLLSDGISWLGGFAMQKLFSIRKMARIRLWVLHRKSVSVPNIFPLFIDHYNFLCHTFMLSIPEEILVLLMSVPP